MGDSSAFFFFFCIFLTVFDFFSFNLISISVISMYPMCFSLCLSYLHFMDFSGYFLPNVKEVFNYNLFIYCFRLFLFWGPYNSNDGALNFVPEISETIFNSFHSFIFILLHDSYSIFQFAYSFFCLSYSIDSL